MVECGLQLWQLSLDRSADILDNTDAPPEICGELLASGDRSHVCATLDAHCHYRWDGARKDHANAIDTAAPVRPPYWMPCKSTLGFMPVNTSTTASRALHTCSASKIGFSQSLITQYFTANGLR